MNIHRRHDLSDKIWERLSPHLPGREGAWGGKACDNRQFINAVCGYCARGHLGAIYRLIMVAGATHIDALSVGATRVCGNRYLSE
jgi:transposase